MAAGACAAWLLRERLRCPKRGNSDAIPADELMLPDATQLHSTLMRSRVTRSKGGSG